jgi:outer membrane protein TolC
MSFVLAVPLATALLSTAPTADALLAELLAEADRRNPDIEAARASAAAARERPRQASAWPDPMVGLGFTNEGWAPNLGTKADSALELMVAQDLPSAGTRRLRGRLAEIDATVADLALARARLAVAAAVRRSYYGLLAARALRAITVDQASLWEQMEGVARARYGVGEGSQQDVLRTQVELTRVQEIAAAQDAEIAIRLAELNRLLARSPDTPLETDAGRLSAAESPGDPETLGAALRARSPELAAATSAVEGSQVAVDLARRESRPAFGVQAAYANRAGLEPMWRAGVTVTVPLARGRRQGRIAEAEAAATAARARLAAIELQLRFRTHERLAQLEAARRIAVLYGDGIVPQDRMSVEAAIASYRAGRIPFVTVLEAVATLYADRATHVRVLAASQQARAALDEASLESTSLMPDSGVKPSMSSAPATSGMAR